MKINGSLIFDASSASEIQNLRVQKVSSNPTHTANDVGRLIYNTGDNVIYIGGASAWVALATGGNATALQTEVDNLEVALGDLVNESGQFQAAEFAGFTNVASPTDLLDVLSQLDSAISGKDALSELVDVTITAAAEGDFLRHNGTDWVDHVLVAADLSDVTATAAELNILDGATLSVTELNYVTGVTSGIQGQLDAKQDEDATLTALAGLNADAGIVVQTGEDAFTKRTLTAPAAGITITNPAGTAGNPTFALANDLAALEGLTTVGYIARTGDGTAATRSMSVVSGDLAITGDANGASTDTTFGLATVSQAATGDFVKVTLDGKGRVVGNTPVVTGDITALVDATYVNVSGDSMSTNASLVFSGTGTVTGLPAPANDTDAANKAYVDALTSGLSWKQAVRVATTANVDLASELENGDTIDGVALVTGDRVLVKNQSVSAENGIYVVQASGAAVRASDMNAASEFDGAAVFVKEGTTNQGTGWTETATVSTVGTDTVAFSQFSGGALYTWGVGLTNSGNTVNVNLGAGIIELPTDEVGLDVESGKAVQLTSTSTGGQLTFVLDGGSASGLEQSASGLKISAGGVTNAMLDNSQFTINADSGTDSLVLGDTLEIKGNSVQGIVTSVVESPAGTSTFTVTASDASTTQKGVASFATGDFDVTAGVVTIKTAGVDNAQLANSTVTVTGTTGTDAVALGESLAIIGGAGGEVSTAMGTNSLAISVRDATASLKGVASFDAADFTVTAGAVTAVAKSIDSLTDVTLTSPTDGDILVMNGSGQFVNQKAYYLYTGASAATHTVTHNLGQKFCVVTVVDSTDEVVIPQSITFNSANQLTVVFNTAIACSVVVMGIA